jgi:hypothetical protein
MCQNCLISLNCFGCCSISSNKLDGLIYFVVCWIRILFLHTKCSMICSIETF